MTDDTTRAASLAGVRPGDAEARARVMAREYAAGATLRELGQMFGIDNKTVWHHLAKAGVSTRRTGPRGRTDVETAWIVALRERGESWREIADAVGMSQTGCRSRYRRAQGLPRWRG